MMMMTALLPLLSLSLMTSTMVYAQSAAAGEAAAGGADSAGNSTLCAVDPMETYNLPFHIGGIFIVLAVSGLGTFGTLTLGTRTKNSLWISMVLQLFKMFGIGVIAGTAWIHLLPDAFSQFGSPCLPDRFAAYGPNYVGLFAMIAAFSVQILEMSAFSHKRRKFEKLKAAAAAGADKKESPGNKLEIEDHTHSHAHGHANSHGHGHGHAHSHSHQPKDSQNHQHDHDSKEEDEETSNSLHSVKPHESPADTTTKEDLLDNSTHSDARLHVGPSEAELTVASCEQFNDQVEARAHGGFVISVTDVVPVGHSGALIGEEDAEAHLHNDNQNLSVVILEAGILFHSLIIGLTLGVTAGDKFTTLLIAICFHQLFEGMALGVLIGNLKLVNLTKFLGLGLIYPLTTPTGIAIGIGIRNIYNGNDPNLILAQGILDSLSAGILFYNTYAELISLEINHNSVFVAFSREFKFACFICMYAGAAAMAVVGIWA